MKKRWLVIVFLVAALLAGSVPPLVAAPSGRGISLRIGSLEADAGGKAVTLDAAPFIQDGRTFVPLRFVSEALGASVQYTQKADGSTEKVTVDFGGLAPFQTWTIGVAEVDLGGEVVALDAAPLVRDSRTFVPVRFVAEAMGGRLQVVANPDGSTGQVLIQLPLSQKERDLVKPLANGFSDFGFRLMRQVAAEQTGKNIFLSPLSAALALSMTAQGAKGDTFKAMAASLGLSDFSSASSGGEKLAQAASLLMESLAAMDPEQVTLEIANALFANRQVPFEEDFLARCQESYQAEVNSLDFADPSTLQAINDWARQKTHGRIDGILDQLEPQDVMVLLNAIYFLGRWSRPFPADQTREADFTLSDGSTVQVPRMGQDGEFEYLEGEGFQAIRLPYASSSLNLPGSDRLSMAVLLPERGTSLEQFLAMLDGDQWRSWMESMAGRKGRIELPRFRVEFKTSLKDALIAIGMGAAFDPDLADFSGMASLPAWISDVIQKTFVEVKETGTEAAAVTAVVMKATGMMEPPPPPFQMIVDRPFLFAITDRETGALLFLGSIQNPAGS
ncbi:MAG: serpin family protein [bacterium]